MDTKGDFEFEQFTICGCCKQKFNDTECVPKELTCKHCFCLRCVKTTMLRGSEVYCIDCWKRTELNEQPPETLQTQNSVLSLIRYLANVKVNQYNVKQRKGEDCRTHAMPFRFWCYNCQQLLCRGCEIQSDHIGHTVKLNNDARNHLTSEVQSKFQAISKMMSEIQNLNGNKRQFLFRVLDACNTLKTQIEQELNSDWSQNTNDLLQTNEVLNSIKPKNLSTEELYDLQLHLNRLEEVKKKVQNKYSEPFANGRLEDIISSTNLLDLDMIKQSLFFIHTVAIDPNKFTEVANLNNHIFFLANYCTAQLFTRYALPKNVTQSESVQEIAKNFPGNSSTTQYTKSISSISSNEPVPITPQTSPRQAILNNITSVPSFHSFPKFYFNIKVNDTILGRLVIETRSDIAPNMSKNFEKLTVGDANGYCYKGCSILQCWPAESVIIGDFEMNNKRGGKSIHELNYFIPDNTNLPAIRGAVGMRRVKRYDENSAMVKSQFRIMLQNTKGITAIFGRIVDGIDIVDKMAKFGDKKGNPTKKIVISSCGKL